MTDEQKTCQQCGTPMFGEPMKSAAGVLCCSAECVAECDVATKGGPPPEDDTPTMPSGSSGDG